VNDFGSHLVASVRHVDARDVHSRIVQLFQLLKAVCGWANATDNFGSSIAHGDRPLVDARILEGLSMGC